MKYHLRANATFEAENLDDAFTRLAEHCLDLVGVGASEGHADTMYRVDTPKFFDQGDLELCEVGYEGMALSESRRLVGRQQ